MIYSGCKKRGILYIASLILASTVFNAVAVAQSRTENSSQAAASSYQFDLDSGSLRRLVSQISTISGWRIFYTDDVSSDVRTAPVSGRYSVNEALGIALRQTGLAFRVTGERSILVVNQHSADRAVAPDEGGTVLDTILISGGQNAASGSGFQGTPDWVYQAPSAVSVISRQAILNAGARNARDLLDNVGGVYANRSEGQNPGININIRGLQDQGRVVTMIDGARQDFQRNGHGSAQKAYVDTAFIRAIDIEKGGVSGVGGAGSLGGSVNFRTIQADDLIKAGKNWGAEFNARTGTNEFQFDGSAAAAVRLSDSFSILGGISHKKIGEYKVGKNGEITLVDTSHEGGAIVSTGQKSVTGLLKAEAEFNDDLKGSLSWMRYDTDFMQGAYNAARVLDQDVENVINNTVVADLAWSPDNELIDVKTKVWFNNTKNKETRGATPITPFDVPVHYGIESYGLSVENTSRFDTASGTVAVNYGVEAFRDSGKTEVLTATEFDNGLGASESYTGMTPTGKRDVTSAFVNATLEHDAWLIASAGLRYDHYKLNGHADIYGNARRDITVIQLPDRCPVPTMPTLCFPGGTETVYGPWERDSARVDVDRSQGAFLPSVMVAVKPVDWFQPFAKYSRNFRPPSIMEAFIRGGHPGASVSANAPNPSLEAETGNNFELGANIIHDGIFAADDRLRVKAVGFYKQIDNYISIGWIRRPEIDRQYSSFVNLDGETKIKGVELEASYDAGKYYVGSSFTWLHTDFSDSYTFNGQSYPAEPGVLFVPPKFKMTIDAGLRMVDEKLILGGRVTHVGGTSPAIGLLTASYVTSDYTIVDLYGSYDFNEITKLKFAVDNVADVAYVPALGINSLPAPGRTFTASLSLKF